MGGSTADIGGLLFRDNNDARVTAPAVIPAGTTLAPGGYYVLARSSRRGQFAFGLGGADSARLSDRGATRSSTRTAGRRTRPPPTAAARRHGRLRQSGRVEQGRGERLQRRRHGRRAAGAAARRRAGGGAAGAAGRRGGQRRGGAAGTGGGAPAPAIRINEIESNRGTPGDWVELYNAGHDRRRSGGWLFRDNDDTHNYLIPAGTSIAAWRLFRPGRGGVRLRARRRGVGAALRHRHGDRRFVHVDRARGDHLRPLPERQRRVRRAASSTKGAANACGGGGRRRWRRGGRLAGGARVWRRCGGHGRLGRRRCRGRATTRSSPSTR